MKNIHVLPTDKLSIICKLDNVLVLSKIGTLTNDTKSLIRQNIYITSDEEIKDVRPHKGKWQLEKEQILNKFPNYLTDLSECKLVILTTDQDLIKDGVQAIDDEFLEWFVKNPSCESVEIEMVEFGYDEKPICEYKIVIPKEGMNCWSGKKGVEGWPGKEEPKQEIPTELESVLAKITHQNDLGLSQWYEVVYYDDNKWCSYSGSKTFQDGERVIEWKYCKDCL
jgi:hypothetical protein